MSVTASAIPGLPEITPGDDLATLIAEHGAPLLAPGAVICVAQKLVSKAEGRTVALADVTPTPLAISLANARGDRGDARHVQVILDESEELLRAERGVLICRTRHGFVCANAGVDRSNAPPGTAILLPLDPDASARRLRATIQRRSGLAPLAVIVTDSFGRAWRRGQVDTAIGVSGIAPLAPPATGEADRGGRPLVATVPAVADELAALSNLARRKDDGGGVVVVTGVADQLTGDDGPGAAALVRPLTDDLFR
ncbi:MAG: coenzyme F420-0:L-glutamate ligase [Patulibacter sp.]